MCICYFYVLYTLWKENSTLLHIFPPQGKSRNHKYFFVKLVTMTTKTLQKFGQEQKLLYPAAQKHIYVKT